MKNTKKAFATPLLIALISVMAVLTIGTVLFLRFIGSNNEFSPNIQKNVGNQTNESGITNQLNDGEDKNSDDDDFEDHENESQELIDESAASETSEDPDSLIGEPINVLMPVDDDKLVIGEEVKIEWDEYEGEENLIITLQIKRASGQIRNKIIASEVPNTGEYSWIVSEESSDSTYRIEIHPVGTRELVGRSGLFYISVSGDVGGDGSNGVTVDDRIKNVMPSKNSIVDASKPIEITGLAKGVYHEAEFSIEASYILDGQKEIITQTYASCNFAGDGCEWMGDEFLEFKGVLDLSLAPSCEIKVELARSMINDGDTPDVFHDIPLSLYGITGCDII